MSRLVVVSNRIAQPGAKKNSAGGLAVGILDALQHSGGIWFGWSGKTGDPQTPLEEVKRGGVSWLTFTLSQEDYEQYYSQFANGVLWPAFHYRLDLVNYTRDAWEGYLRVNRQIAGQLQPHLASEDIIWAHDYHLIPLAAALRAGGCQQRMGFFLHIPFPAPAVFNALPTREALLKQLTAYDLIGFQTHSDCQAFLDGIAAWTSLSTDSGGVHSAWGRRFRTGVYPIGIAPEEIATEAGKPLPAKMAQIKAEAGKVQNIFSVERLDYSKGLPERFRAYEALLANWPQHLGRIRYTQIAPTSRGEVQAYQDIRHQLETEAGRINGAYGQIGWTPVYYLNQYFDRKLLMKIFRYSDVGLVTPLRDGMNLVAKEYVAAQNPDNPGVLVLSQFAGAADELDAALVVNPYDCDDVAQALHRALTMPLNERKTRHEAMMSTIKQHDIQAWQTGFLQDLKQASPVK